MTVSVSQRNDEGTCSEETPTSLPWSFTREGWVQGCVFFTGALGASFVEQVQRKHCLEEGK